MKKAELLSNFLKNPTRIMGNQYYWKMESEVDGVKTTVELSVYLGEKEDYDISTAGQLTVFINGYKLKEVYRDWVNTNNYGVDPRSGHWNHDKFENRVGDKCLVHLCEYGMGDGGEITVGDFKRNIDKEQASSVLKIYRNQLLNTIRKEQN